EVTYEWSKDNSECTATRVCANDPSHVETETVKATSEVTKQATCEEDGETVYTAVFENPVFETQTTKASIPAKTGHDWGEVTYEWSADNGKVTATRVCKTDKTHVETETVATTSKVTKAATVDAKGVKTFTSDAFKNPAFSVQTKDTDLPRLTPTPTPTLPADDPSVKLKINKANLAIPCGKTDTLKATLIGSSDKITWKSSNTKIATVDANGKIAAKKAGSVMITASAAGKKATCTVQVLFKDVTNSKDFWYTPTYYLTDKKVVKGYDNQTLFKPANICTRAQMVTFIWRLMGQPAPKTTSMKFKDVKKTDYFYQACLWGNENHIVEGYKNGTFGPKINCARRHAVTFLWRLAGKPEPATKKNKFSDLKKSDYFYKATLWASEKKILEGYSDGTFRPNGNCLRRQMVTFLYKYDKFVNGKG
ncbi:MAG: S-layer homology domain-containing protein, partial [Clostridiales bacterium]|nr:S-layer homology domain-containing protein [Clostridiales bacterium]